MNFNDQESQVLVQQSDAAEGIENLVLSFLTQLVDTSSLDFDEKTPAHERRAKSKIQLQLANRRTKGSTKTLTYPKKCNVGSVRPMGERIYAHTGNCWRVDAWHPAQLLRVMDLAHEAIIENVPMTKRCLSQNNSFATFLNTRMKGYIL